MNLTVRDASKLLNVSEKSIYRWITQGRLPAYRVQDQYRFNRAELLEWATANRIEVSPDICQEPESVGSPLPCLSSALEDGGIYYRVEGADRDSVLQAIVRLMRISDDVDRDFLFKVLRAREELGSTGIGDGIAIPHVRNPIVLHVARPAVTLCFLEKPIDFKALDGQPVHILFTLVSPTVRAHLHMLSRLSFALQDQEFRAGLKAEHSREALLGQVRRIEAGLAKKNGPGEKP